MPLAARDAVAQEWATKMFKETSHNFGTVARNAKVEYRFEFYNPYKETIHVAAVSSSCGCTTPEIAKREVNTYERSEVIARFNTDRFTGNHAATLTVTFDRPYYAVVQLSVSGDIRGDIEVQSAGSTVSSGAVDFGTVDQGETRERKITVIRYGRSDWQITDVRSVNSSYEVEVVNTPRSPGRVAYDLIVRLKKDAAPGFLHDPLILVTNDPTAAQFPIEVEGVVRAELSISPQVLMMGTVEAGQQATRMLVVSGHKPFKVVGAHSDDNAYSFKIPTGAEGARFARIPVTFTAPNKPGKLVDKIKIETDLGATFNLEVLAQADVIESSTPPSATTDAKTADPKSTDAKVADPKNADTKKTDTKNVLPNTTNTTGGLPNGAVLKLDSGSNTVNSSAVNSGAVNSSAAGGAGNTLVGGNNISPGPTPAAQPPIKPSSVMPNPIRPRSGVPAPPGAAAAN